MNEPELLPGRHLCRRPNKNGTECWRPVHDRYGVDAACVLHGGPRSERKRSDEVTRLPFDPDPLVDKFVQEINRPLFAWRMARTQSTYKEWARVQQMNAETELREIVRKYGEMFS